MVDFSKVDRIQNWSFLETCLGFDHMDPFLVQEIHSFSILFCSASEIFLFIITFSYKHAPKDPIFGGRLLVIV